MKTLVTGGAGFIGSTLADRLLADGHQVVVADDLSTGSPHNVEAARGSSSYRFAEVDVTTAQFVDLVAEHRPEVVHHLAAQVDVRVSVADPLKDARLNVLGTINVLEAARRAGVRKVVFTSSGGSIYGSPDALPVAETHPVDPQSPYAASKAAGEIYLGAYRHMYGVAATSLALGNVYGPRQDPHGEAGVVAIFATAMLEGRPTRIFGDGTSVRDYVYVDDVVAAFVAAMTTGEGERFNIGTGRQTTVRELHRLIAAATGTADEPQLAPPRTGELQAIALDHRRAGELLGWSPQVELQTGIERTVAWVRSTL